MKVGFLIHPAGEGVRYPELFFVFWQAKKKRYNEKNTNLILLCMQVYQSKRLTSNRWESRFSALRSHQCSFCTRLLCCDNCSRSLSCVKLFWISDTTNSASPGHPQQLRSWLCALHPCCSPKVSPNNVSLQDEGHRFVFPAASTREQPFPWELVNISGAVSFSCCVRRWTHHSLGWQ